MKTKSSHPKAKWNFLDSILPHASDFPAVEIVKSNESCNPSQEIKKLANTELAEAISNVSLTTPSQSNLSVIPNKENASFKTIKSSSKNSKRDLEDEFIKMNKKLLPSDSNFANRMAFDIYKRSTVLERLENYVKANKPKQVASQDTFNRLYEDSKKKTERSTEKSVTKKENSAKPIQKRVFSPQLSKPTTATAAIPTNPNNFNSFVQKVVEDCNKRHEVAPPKCLSQNISPEMKSEKRSVSSARPKSVVKSPPAARKVVAHVEKGKYSNLSKAIKDILSEEIYPYIGGTNSQNLLSKYDINAVEICI